MKTFHQILALSALVPLASAATQGYITSFTAPDCGQAAGAGGVVQRVETLLPLKSCVNVKLFTSFQGGLSSGSCGKGKSPKVTAYTESDCTGTAVDGGTIPTDGEDGPCEEIVAETGSSSVSVGGHSALFTCV